MGEVSFADGFDAPDRIAFGLAAPQLAVAAAGLAGAYLTVQSPLPGLMRIPLAVLVLASAALLAWGRAGQRPMLTWAVLMARFAVRPHQGPLVLATDGHPDDGPGDPTPEESTSEPDSDLVPRGDEPQVSEPPPVSDEPPWARWLRSGGGGRAEADVPPDQPPEGETGGVDEQGAEPGVLTVEEVARPVPPPDGHGASSHAGGGQPTGRLEITRTPLVLLPTPASHEEGGGRPGGLLDDLPDADTDLPEGDLDLPDAGPVVLPLAGHRVRPDQMPPVPLAVLPDHAPAAGIAPPRTGSPEVAPVFVGATRRITFFSLNGGAGRTTLATEVACLLAARGRCRAAPDDQPRPLRVALLDLDLRSATVSVHLGIPQPTVWDYMVAGRNDPSRIEDYMVSHASGLRALLGPPKPLTSDGTTLEPARVAEIVHQLERDGTHFIIIDVSGDLNALTTWVLSAVHDIYVVLTPTASGVQDAYRTTESLRRMGLASKLRYVVNRARGPVDFRETMGDLGGRIVATIPYDPCIEEAENHHRIAALDTGGPAVDGIHALAAHIFPGLATRRREGRLARLFRRRRAG